MDSTGGTGRHQAADLGDDRLTPGIPAQVPLAPGLARLRLEEITSFVVLSEELHFARAAARLFITPTGLSRRIASVERGLGERLVNRTTRSVELTGAGQIFAAQAAKLLALLQSGSTAPRRADGLNPDSASADTLSPPISGRATRHE